MCHALPGGRTRLAALFVSVTLAAAAASQARGQGDDPAPPADHPVDRAVQVLEQLDTSLVSIDYAGLPLEHVLVDLGRQMSVPLHADWLSLELLGIKRDTPIAFRLDNVPLSTALAGLLLDMGTEFDRPSFEYHEGRIVITTLDATARMRMIATYNIRDLLADETLVDRLEREAPLPTISQESGESGSEDDISRNETEDEGEVPALARRTPGEALLDLIADHVDPEAWLEYGGNRAKITEHEGVLLVSAPASLHKKLRDAIEQLRRAIPSHVWLDAAVLTIPERNYQSLVRKHRRGTTGLARAMMREPSASIAWRARAASVAIGTEYVGQVESDGSMVRVAVTPELAPDTQMLRLIVDASVQSGDHKASVTTSANCPDRSSAAILELAGQADDDVLRFVVLVPRTG